MITRQHAEALIPTEVSREILQAAPRFSYALRLLRRLANMTAKQRTMPILSALVSAGFVSGDTGLKATTSASWEKKTIEAEEIAAVIPIPEAVLADAGYDIWGELKERILEAFGVVIDQAVFFGTDRPVHWPEGLVPQALAAGNQVALGTGMDIAADISEMMGLVEQDGFEVGAILSDVAAKGELRSLRDLNHQPIYQPSLTAGTPGLLYGIPVTHMKNGAWDSGAARILLGDFSQAVYAIRQDISYKVLDQAVITNAAGEILYNLAQQDMVALRVVMRLGWQIANPVTRLNPDGQTRFPFAVGVGAGGGGQG